MAVGPNGEIQDLMRVGKSEVTDNRSGLEVGSGKHSRWCLLAAAMDVTFCW